MQSKVVFQFAVLSTVAASLVACGGGGGSSASSAQTLQGQTAYSSGWTADSAQILQTIPVSATQLLCDSGIDTTCLSPTTPTVNTAAAVPVRAAAAVPENCLKFNLNTKFSFGKSTYYMGKTYNAAEGYIFTGYAPDHAEHGSTLWIVDPNNACSGLAPVPIASSALIETPYAPPVGDQATAGTCAAWATSTAITTASNKAANRTDKVARADMSNIASARHIYTQMPDPTDAAGLADKRVCWGTSLMMVMSNVVKTGGVGSFQSAPYAPIGTGTSERDASVNQCAYSVAVANNKAWSADKAKFKIDGVRLVPRNVQSIKSELRAGNAVAFGARLNQAFYDAAQQGKVLTLQDVKASLASGNPHSGGHAMTIVGFDDNIKAFKVQNSWGTGWGENGYIFVAYDLMVDTTSFAMDANLYVPFVAPNAAAVAATTAALKNTVKGLMAGSTLYIDLKNVTNVSGIGVRSWGESYSLSFTGDTMNVNAPSSRSVSNPEEDAPITYSELELLAAAHKYLNK